MRDDRCDSCSARLKIMSLVLESCLMTSLTQSLMPSFCGSLMSLAGTIHGPIGQASSKHFWPTQSHLNGVAGDVVERLLQRHVFGLLADHGAELGLPVDRVRGFGQLHCRLVADHG